MVQIMAGVAKANVTPPLGMLMSGYGSRKTGAEGVYDELETVALYLSDGQTEAGLITADLIDTGREGTARIRAVAEELSGVPGAHIMVSMSHTHGGPHTTLWLRNGADELMEAYSTVAVAQMASALAQAKRSATPVRVGYGRQDCDIAANRRERTPSGVILGVNLEGPTQPYADVVRLDSLETGEPLAIVMAYAAHGTTLTERNLLYTADYIGFAKRAVERQVPTAHALYIAGCSGDINPYPRGEFAHAESHGLRLGCAASQAAYEVSDMVQDRPLALASVEVALKTEAPPPLKEARAALAELETQAAQVMESARAAAGGADVQEAMALDWWEYRQLSHARGLVKALEAGESEFSIPIEVQALVIGESAIVGMPGEIFVEIGQAVVEASPFENTIAISHTNGSAGYIPTAKEVPAGGYEIQAARGSVHGLTILPASDEVVIQAGIQALQACWEQLNG